MTKRAMIVGSGPNGLSAGIVLARAGLQVTILEAAKTHGGGARCAELTLPGYRHDVCSAVYPLTVVSPFLSSLELEKYGLKWIFPPAIAAHPLDHGKALVMPADISALPEILGEDAARYRDVFENLVRHSSDLFKDILGPLSFPRHPFLLAGFGIKGIQSVTHFAQKRFKTPAARAFLAGLGAHASLPLDALFTTGFALVLGLAGHARGWPVAEGGSQSISDALAECFKQAGGKIVTGAKISKLKDLGDAELYFFDTDPSQLAAICGLSLPRWYQEKLKRYQYGPGVFKMDFALSDPVPWSSAECNRAATVHIGGELEEIALSESEVSRGMHPARPFIIAAQPSLFDSTRAPAGKHILWAYCHVPNGSTVDMSERIESQIERFAPGFRKTILARHSMNTAAFEGYNPNYRGGDISAGATGWPQLFARPVGFFHPYRTPVKKVYICSASAPPGPGVHGLCGYHAAMMALKDLGER